MSTTASQQFEGTTIEEALAAAVAELGDDLEIIDAQRVRRRGALALRRRERFEVTAAPRRAEPRGFDDVLRRMVERVDEAERVVGADLADTDPAWWQEADFVLPDASGGVQIDLDGRDRRRSVRRSPAPPAVATAGPVPGVGSGTATATVEAPTLVEEARQVFHEVVTESPAPAPQPVVTPEPDRAPVVVDDAPRWSREALLALDLPPALVGRLRCDELHADLDWVAALAKAIAELLETAERMSGPCELTGHGAASVVHLLRGACDGFRLDSLIIDGRRVPAAPLELALAVRSLLRTEP